MILSEEILIDEPTTMNKIACRFSMEVIVDTDYVSHEIKRVLENNPGVKKYILTRIAGTNPNDEHHNDFTQNMRSLYSQHWGANMENMFNHSFYALSVLDNTCLFYLPVLFNVAIISGD